MLARCRLRSRPPHRRPAAAESGAACIGLCSRLYSRTKIASPAYLTRRQEGAATLVVDEAVQLGLPNNVRLVECSSSIAFLAKYPPRVQLKELYFRSIPEVKQKSHQTTGGSMANMSFAFSSLPHAIFINLPADSYDLVPQHRTGIDWQRSLPRSSRHGTSGTLLPGESRLAASPVTPGRRPIYHPLPSNPGFR